MLRMTLTTITLLLASQSLIVQAKEFTFYNASSLANREWACRYTMTHKIDNRTYDPNTGRYKTNYRSGGQQTYKSTTSTILSLKPGNSWDAGKAWILKVTHNRDNNNETKFEAWKGFYHFYGDGNDADNLILKIGFVRKYDGDKNNHRISWKLDTDFDKKGARIDIPLDEQTVPSKRVSLSVVKGYFVDSKGNQTLLRDEPYGILEKLAGRGSIRTVYSTEFIDLGESIEMSDSSAATILRSTGLGNSLPTGCRLHQRRVSK